MMATETQRARRVLIGLLCAFVSLWLAAAAHADTATKDPTSDDAVSGTWDGSAGTRYTLVDDYPDSSGADFLTHGTTTAGNLTLGFSAFSIPAGSTSISVQVLYYDQKTASQSCNITARLKIGGSYFNLGSNHNPANGTWISRTDDFGTTNPKSSAAWTVDDVNGVGSNALQAAGWVSTDASPTIRLASLRVQVTYTPPVTGSGAVTDTSDASSGSSTSKWVLTAAATEGADAGSAGATSKWVLTGAGTDAADSLAASGDVESSGISGSAAPTESADAGSAGSTAEHILNASTTEATETAAGSTTAEHILSASSAESADSLSASAVDEWILTASTTEATETAAGSATSQHVLSASSAESADSSAAAALASWILQASPTENAETTAGSATSQHVLSASPAESADALAGSGSLEGGPIGGNGALVETADASSAGSTAEHVLNGSSVDSADTPVASVVSAWVLQGFTTESTEDGVEAQGAIAWIASAALGEPQDIAAGAGSVSGEGSEVAPPPSRRYSIPPDKRKYKVPKQSGA
jgi:hypothetical protein